ncbi:MAG TPA: hypothetical protein VHO03_20625 [Ignavibacteriales bacterium]|nr:hypothetical protein [Ignavibacteriales bacterium]
MKKALLIVLLLAASVFAQRKSFFEGEMDNGGFGGPQVKFSSVKNNFGVLAGGYGGWLINHQVLIGFGGYGLANNIKANSDVQNLFNYRSQPYVNFGYGGGVLEYYFTPDELLHSSVSLLIGAGGVSYRSANSACNWDSDNWNDDNNGDVLFVLEPGISGELNVAKFMKVGFNVSYRFVNGVDTYGLKNSDFSNFSGGIALKFGVF